MCLISSPVWGYPIVSAELNDRLLREQIEKTKNLKQIRTFPSWDKKLTIKAGLLVNITNK